MLGLHVASSHASHSTVERLRRGEVWADQAWLRETGLDWVVSREIKALGTRISNLGEVIGIHCPWYEGLGLESTEFVVPQLLWHRARPYAGANCTTDSIPVLNPVALAVGSNLSVPLLSNLGVLVPDRRNLVAGCCTDVGPRSSRFQNVLKLTYVQARLNALLMLSNGKFDLSAS